MNDVRVESFKEVYWKRLKVPCIAVYKSPEDYQGYCVARIYEKGEPTNIVMIKKNLKEIEEDIHKNTKMTFIQREKEDVASLVGTWL